MMLDDSHYYRFSTRVSGKEYALDVSPDGTGRLLSARPADVSGQYWRVLPRGDGQYLMTCAYLGEALSLTMSKNGSVRLVPTDLSAGQSWAIEGDARGSYTLVNLLGGPRMCLRVHNGSFRATNSTAKRPRHLRWTLTSLAPAAPAQSLPAFREAPGVYCPEGPTDFQFYERPIGTLKAVMLFVDFPDAPGDPSSLSDTAEHLLGNGRAQALFSEQSYGACQVEVDVRSDLGWKRLGESSGAYDCHEFASHRRYLADAAARFAGEVAFPDYRFVLIVASPSALFPDSPAFNARPGEGAVVDNHEIRLAVTFGRDSYRNSYINLVHEVSHLMGLPDLYPYGGNADNSRAGCWDIMSDIFHCTTFLGWHRHKNGWLPVERVLFLPEPQQERYVTLSPLSSRFGISMIVLPIDDPQRPARVFVVELAQPRVGAVDGSRREGLLIYTVDVTIPTGHSPVVVQPRIVSTSPDEGYLCEATYRLGDSASVIEAGAGLNLWVLQQFGDCFHVKLQSTRL
jgi:M6 family metalloprotease-like protein